LNCFVCLITLIYLFVKSLPWLLDIHGSKISFYRKIFLLQYCASKCLLWIRPYLVKRVKTGKKFEKWMVGNTLGTTNGRKVRIHNISWHFQYTLDQSFINLPQACLSYHVTIKLLISSTLFSLPTPLLKHFHFTIIIKSLASKNGNVASKELILDTADLNITFFKL